MQNLHLYGRCKALRLLLPISQERSRNNQQHPRLRIRPPHIIKPREDLQCFAKAHIICQARSKPHFLHVGEPVKSRLLIGTKSGFYCCRNTAAAHSRRLPQLCEHRPEPLPVRYQRSDVNVLRFANARLHAERLQKRHGSLVLLHRIEHCPEPGVIYNDPFALKQCQSLCLCKEFSDLRAREGDSVNSQFRLHGD